MSVVPLIWKDGEGYDVHVLRGGPSSKALDQSFNIDPQFTDPLVFTPHFKGAPNAQGVAVDIATGAVTASAPPAPPAPKLRNFLMTVSQTRGQDTAQTLIRIHLHDSIRKIWLTPATLTIHRNANECRFTVLAQFDDDGTVGDITDWPQLTYASADPDIADMQADGTLKVGSLATALGRQVDITATLNLSTPATNLSATAKAITALLEWSQLAVTVQFVDGPLRPNLGNGDFNDETTDGPDLGTTNKNSFPNVALARTNILFVSEGFTQSQQADFTKAVEDLIKDKTTGLASNLLEPFKLLKGSINYWSLFVPSQDDGISVLGDYQIVGKSPKQMGDPVDRPEEPDPTFTSWSLANMIHQLGLPAPQDPKLSIADWIVRWNQLYDTQVTPELVSVFFSNWDALRSRSPLNERDTIFGFANGARPRVSDAANGDPLLRPAPRRTSEASLDQFIKDLSLGTFNIGQYWDQFAKDRGFVCFICLSDTSAGEARTGYFSATTGLDFSPALSAAPNGNGWDIKTAALSDPKAPYNRGIFASRVAHGCGHACGLGDEYGPGNGAFFSVTAPSAVLFPNLQSKDAITSTTGSQTTYNPALIKWALPRVLKLAVMTSAPVDQGNNVIQMQLAPGQGSQFKQGDLVVMRQPPLYGDPFKGLRFTVVQSYANAVDVTESGATPMGIQDIKLSFDQNKTHVLIGASSPTSQGVELKLIADKVLNYIGQSGGPLNAPASNPQAACLPSNNAKGATMYPTFPKSFLKFNKKAPLSTADIVGIYEGGGHFDCGVFRPAGRCQMRTAAYKLIPFCQVCRYVIVDRIDATQLNAWDKQYDPNYPA